MKEPSPGSGPCFGILYPGEMGASFGRVLMEHDFEVLTALDGRSSTTRARARDAGFQDVGTLAHLIDRADYLLSFVPPGAAPAIAVLLAALPAPSETTVLVDFNSIGPHEVEKIRQSLRGTAIDYVDGAIHGQAGRLQSQAVIYLSGNGSDELVELLGTAFRVRGLGESASAASTFKMLLSALSKTLVTSFLEVGIVAQKMGQLELFIDQVEHFYPSLIDAVGRMGPTYPRHVGRRVEEMKNVESTIASQGLRPGAASEARRFLEELESAELASDRESWTLGTLIEALAAAGVLQQRSRPDSQRSTDEQES